MKSAVYFTIYTLIFALAIAHCFADNSGSVGVTYNRVVGQQSGGLTADYEYTTEPMTIELDGQLQIGDIYRGKAHGEVLFDVETVGIKLIVDLAGQGYQIETMGVSNTVAAALNIPVRDLSVDIGIGGNNAAPWGKPNAFDTLVGEGFSEDDIEGLGLENIGRASTSIPFRKGNFVQLFIAAELEKNNIDIDLRGIVEPFGGDKAQQLHAGFQTSREFGIIDVTARIEVGLMAYGDVIYRDGATSLSFGTRW